MKRPRRPIKANALDDDRVRRANRRTKSSSLTEPSAERTRRTTGGHHLQGQRALSHERMAEAPSALWKKIACLVRQARRTAVTWTSKRFPMVRTSRCHEANAHEDEPRHVH